MSGARASTRESICDAGRTRDARELALTTRRLQSRLRDAGTSWRAESRISMVRKAKVLLATTADKIAYIASTVGCDSAQHFTELFTV